MVSDSSCYFCSLGSCLIFLRLGFRIHEMGVIIWSSLPAIWKFSVGHSYISNSWAQCPANGNSLSSWHHLLLTFWCSISGFREKVLVGLYKTQMLKGLGNLVHISAQTWGGESVVRGVLYCSWASGFHSLSFIPNPEKRIPLPTYRTLYQEFITGTTVIELGFSFVKYVVSIVHFEVLCIHLWFPVDRLSLVFLFSKLGSAKQESGQLTTSAWQSTFNY